MLLSFAFTPQQQLGCPQAPSTKTLTLSVLQTRKRCAPPSSVRGSAVVDAGARQARPRLRAAGGGGGDPERHRQHQHGSDDEADGVGRRYRPRAPTAAWGACGGAAALVHMACIRPLPEADLGVLSG